MMQGLKRWAAGGILLREVRGLRLEVAGLKGVLERIADALELQIALQQPPLAPVPDPASPGIEISYADDGVTREFMEIELALTAATGQPPSEGQILEEYERRHQGEGLPTQDGTTTDPLLAARARQG